MSKVSVILPTRGRFEMFKKSVKSLLDTSKDLNNFEILVGLDNDDLETIEKVKEFIKLSDNIRLYFYDRQHYVKLNYYYNDLSNKSNGSSLFLWNDDAIMKSNYWDEIILKEHSIFCVLNPKVSNMVNYWSDIGVLFPIIPKKWFDITGHWSYVQACDSWIDILSKRLGILHNVDSIIIEHDRFDLTGNNLDPTFTEGREGVGIDIIGDKELGEIIDIEYQKLNDYLEMLGQNLSTKWGRNINYGK